MNVHDHGIVLRSQAICILEGGPHKEVARNLDVSINAINRWWKASKSNISLITKPRSGRPRNLKRGDKIVISKSLGKCRQSTRKLAQRIQIG